jgi:hypothetical protein
VRISVNAISPDIAEKRRSQGREKGEDNRCIKTLVNISGYKDKKVKA